MKKQLIGILGIVSIFIGCFTIVFFVYQNYRDQIINYWLTVLASNPPKSALNISQIMTNKNPNTIIFEAPISYDLLSKFGFITGDYCKGENGKFQLVYVNDDAVLNQSC